MSQPHRAQTMEDKLAGQLGVMMSGSFSAVCVRVLKRHLKPNVKHRVESNTNESEERGEREGGEEKGGEKEEGMADVDVDVMESVQCSIGAWRALRLHVRNALQTRMARAYIQRETTYSYSFSGAPSHMDIEADILARAWGKEDVPIVSTSSSSYPSSSSATSSSSGGAGWGAGKWVKSMYTGVEDWIGYCLNMDTPERRAGKERILEEVAGVLKDVFQELDMREESETGFERLDEDECAVVGGVLYRLVAYVLPLKWVPLPLIFHSHYCHTDQH
jgi:hypothetical protein